MRQWLLERALPQALRILFYMWCWTLRIRQTDPAARARVDGLTGSYILALWHSRIFCLFYHLRGRADCHLLISPSADGGFLANLARLFGYSVVRGSSYKKAVPAGRSLLKLLRRGQRVIIVADGSRGPRHQAQPGSIQLAAMTGAPVIPMTWDADRRVELGSWDRFVLPLPFSRCAISFGEPIYVPRGAGEAALRAKQEELEAALNRLTAGSR